MKIKNSFSENQISLLAEIGIDLSDNPDYSDSELMEMHDEICEMYLSRGFDERGEPTKECEIWESIIDIFCDDFGI